MKKRCLKCGIEKHVALFNRDGKGYLGRATYCKACEKLRIRAWRRANCG